MIKTTLNQAGSVPARYYRGLPSLLHSKRLEPAPILTSMGISIEQLEKQGESFSASTLEKMVEVLINELSYPEAALELGARIHLHDHSVAGYAIMCSPTVDYALQITARFFKQMFPAFRMHYQCKSKTMVVSLVPAIAMSPRCLQFHIEMVAVALHTGIEDLIPIAMPEDALELSIQEPAHHLHYARVLRRTQVRFSALPSPGISLTLPISIKSAKPAMANPETLALAEHKCWELQQQMLKQRNIGEWVRMMLREASNGLPGIDELAAALNVSERTLHRYLQKEGLVYRRLCVEERSQRAQHFLANSYASITWIAHELGYEDASNFTRAFRKEIGTSPSDYRQQRHAIKPPNDAMQLIN